MEFLRDEDMNKVDPVTETSNNKDSGAERELKLGDPAAKLETPETCPDDQGRNIIETSDNWLRRLYVIGENK